MDESGCSNTYVKFNRIKGLEFRMMITAPENHRDRFVKEIQNLSCRLLGKKFSKASMSRGRHRIKSGKPGISQTSIFQAKHQAR